VGPQQQPVRVVVEKKPSGCWSAFGVLLLIGLAIEYWYVSLGIIVLVVAVGAIAQSQQKKQRQLAEEKARHRPGPRDPWLNEVAVALADLGLVATARNTGAQVGGVPIEGDIGLEADTLAVYVSLFATDELAHQAALGLRARPEVRGTESIGHSAIKAHGRVLYVANGCGGVVDEFRLDEVVRIVDKIALPPPRPRQAAARASSGSQAGGSRLAPSVAPFGAADADALEHLRKLGELRASGVLTEAEFEAKKAELLRRV
jgi:hypothetical protein